MQATSGQATGSALRTLFEAGTLAGAWVLDRSRSSVRLKTKSLGLFPVKGVFHDVGGHGTVTPEGEVTGILRVTVASVDTKMGKRDKHLCSEEIFDSANHPHITFAVDGVRLTDQGLAVTGALTVRGRTRPLSFDATASVLAEGEIRLDAEAPINRGDFGIGWRGDGIASKINILTVRAVFVRG